ncbi:hypothetical protein LINPERHAP1_LOCUS9496 [Linum perenne]
MIQYDRSFVNDSQEAAYGMVLSNIHREFCDRRSDTFFFSSPIIGEGRAILEAFQCATVLSSPVTILSDCKTLVDICLKPLRTWPWECSRIISSFLQVPQERH